MINGIIIKKVNIQPLVNTILETSHVCKITGIFKNYTQTKRFKYVIYLRITSSDESQKVLILYLQLDMLVLHIYIDHFATSNKKPLLFWKSS